MAAQKYLDVVSGVPTQRQASDSSAGAGDAGKIVALDATGKIDSTMMPVGMAPEADSATATEDISAGDLVNLYASSGLKARKADATTAGKEATHFALSAVSNGQSGTFYRPSQTNTQVSGLTAGTTYFLSTTAGLTTSTAPSGSGNVVQRVGKAISATSLDFEPQSHIVLA